MALLDRLLRLFRAQQSNGRGWTRDEIDSRDVKLRDVMGVLRLTAPPPSASLRHPAVVPRDQDGVNACVGFAWAQGLELAYAYGGILTGDLSPQWIYFLGRASRGTAGVDGGMQLRDGAKIVTRFGCASELTCPFRPSQINTSPTWTAYRDAYDRKGLRGYYRIDNGDTVAIKMAIAAGRPVVAGWDVDKSFVDLRGTGIFEGTIGPILGGHALCIVGYDQESFTVLNSWNTTWGDGGYARISLAFARDGNDLWALDVVP